MQFESNFYNTDTLKENIKGLFDNAVKKYNEGPTYKIGLDFLPLTAGYGEHLFNQIARDIIASDIAVFETSDLNPNVMLEMGVALTWGRSVLPIKQNGQPKPPSDVSGQTWVNHENSAKKILDANFEDNLIKLIKRCIERKNKK